MYVYIYIYMYILSWLGVVGSPVAPDMGWLLGYAVWSFSTPRLAKIPSIIDLEPTSPSPWGLRRLPPTNVRKVGVGNSWLWVPWGWCKTRRAAWLFRYSNDQKHCPSVNIRDSCNQMLTAMALFGAVLPNFIAGNVLFCRWNLLASCEKRTSLNGRWKFPWHCGQLSHLQRSSNFCLRVPNFVPRSEQCFAKAKQQRFLGLDTEIWRTCTSVSMDHNLKRTAGCGHNNCKLKAFNTRNLGWLGFFEWTMTIPNIYIWPYYMA